LTDQLITTLRMVIAKEEGIWEMFALGAAEEEDLA
jgi:hypothetical protein